jgi:membrane-associated protease RseP (regulator of RpoE activity)
MNFDHIAFIIFIVAITIFLIIKRKKVEVQKILFPFLYFILYRTNFGLKWMDRISSKHRELVKLFGYISIGFGFVGMIFISFQILFSMLKFFIAPKITEVGMVLVLPGTIIPGIGYLSFFHFLIAILILAIVHEFAHGVVIRAHDLKVKSSGFAFLGIFLPIVPAAFVEPNERKLLKQKPHIPYSVLSAGPIANIVLAIFFLLILMFVMAPIEDRITDPTGFTFDVTQDYPADIGGLESGMLINSFNGEKVEDYNLFIDKLGSCTGPNEVIKLGSEGKEYEITTIEHPEDSSKGFIGVTRIRNEGKIKNEKIGAIFFWFKGLFKWLYLLNIAIGLINLLPIYLTDGAKMLYVALVGSVKSKKRALKIWSMINLVFVILIFVGLFATYLKKFGVF